MSCPSPFTIVESELERWRPNFCVLTGKEDGMFPVSNLIFFPPSVLEKERERFLEMKRHPIDECDRS